MNLTRNARRSLLAASLCLAAAAPAMAQDAHQHPPGATPPPAAATPATPPAGAAPGGMMGQGMMGQGGMMGMMNQGAAAQPGGMSMMSMMGMSQHDSVRLERVDGHLAFLQAELKITEAQQPLWTGFVAAVRANARNHNRTMERPPAAGPLAQIERQEAVLTQRLEGVRAIRTSLAPLYAALSAEQQKTFGDLLPMRMMMM